MQRYLLRLVIFYSHKRTCMKNGMLWRTSRIALIFTETKTRRDVQKYRRSCAEEILSHTLAAELRHVEQRHLGVR